LIFKLLRRSRESRRTSLQDAVFVICLVKYESTYTLGYCCVLSSEYIHNLHTWFMLLNS